VIARSHLFTKIMPPGQLNFAPEVSAAHYSYIFPQDAAISVSRGGFDDARRDADNATWGAPVAGRDGDSLGRAHTVCLWGQLIEFGLE
jgi:hypothetical protein